MLHLGIDPGLTGAVAVLDHNGALQALYDTPTLTLHRSRGTRVRPAIWKRTLGLGKDKEASRLKAIQLFPTADLRRKKDHGRAEALLLAYWRQQHRLEAEVGRCQDTAKN